VVKNNQGIRLGDLAKDWHTGHHAKSKGKPPAVPSTEHHRCWAWANKAYGGDEAESRDYIAGVYRNVHSIHRHRSSGTRTAFAGAALVTC
jgi:hypothetical protein